MKSGCSSSKRDDFFCMSARSFVSQGPPLGLEACDPEGDTRVRFDFPLDWRAVYRRTREGDREGRVPHEVQQALR